MSAEANTEKEKEKEKEDKKGKTELQTDCFGLLMAKSEYKSIACFNVSQRHSNRANVDVVAFDSSLLILDLFCETFDSILVLIERKSRRGRVQMLSPSSS